MLEFIVCDDNKKMTENIINIINKTMISNDIIYSVKKFFDYDNKFIDYIKNKISNVIYILDIETPSKSGIDIARMIRKKDIESIIIFITGHEELGNVILKDELYFLTFINKFDNYEERLERSIEKSLEILGTKKMVRFIDGGCIYTLSINEMLYIIKEKNNRKTIIVTNDSKFYVNLTLKKIIELLPDYFKYLNRSTIINSKRLKYVDKINKSIIFDNDVILK